MQTVLFDSIKKNWSTEDLVNNRLNFKWYATNNLTAAMEMRNRIIYGDMITNNPLVASTYASDNGFLNMTANIIQGNSFILNTNIDRLWLAWEENKIRITLGRQRINWGQCFVWNPNDLFNVYSFFDFDYVERPGSDAVRIQYYNTATNTSEFAIKMNNQNEVTAAGYYKFNTHGYDIQFLGGVLNSKDYMIGTGWSGSISSVAFRGELSYFQPMKTFTDTSGQFMMSIGADHTFGNRMMIQGEFLYSNKSLNQAPDFLSYYNAPLTVQNLAIVNYNFFAQFSYPVTPLLNATFAGMFFLGIRGYYIGPSVSYSLTNNLDVSFYLQSFSGKFQNQPTQNINLAFLRIKMNF